jgi:hypothetical protein
MAFELFIMSGLSELKANNLQWSVFCIVFSQFLRSCHTSSRLPWVDSLFLFICGTSHMSQISSCNSMILRVRAQSIRAIGCHHLCVIHGDLLLTSPSVWRCQLVPSFANALGVFVCSKLLNFISCGLMEALPKLLSVVVVLISTILFSSCAAASFLWIFPCLHNRTYTKILFHWKLYKITLIGAQMRELWPFCLRFCMLSRKFQNAQPSVIRPYPLVGTSDWLDSWFVGSLTSWGF